MGISDSYFSSCICYVHKVGGTYKLLLKTYSLGTLVDEKESEFEPESSSSSIVGTYQTTYPDSYLTDTVVKGKPIDAHNHGLHNFFANCVSFTELHIASTTGIEGVDVVASYGASGGFTYAFYGCTSLETVTFEGTVSVPNFDCSSMFEGCSSLTTINGIFDFSSADYAKCKDMFKDCTSLTGLQIVNGTGIHDITAPLVVDGTTYEHAYEYLGLTESQLEFVVAG